MTEYKGKWMLVVCLMLSVLALSGNVLVSAQTYCTPATCPPGPVIASFEYSNCTGEVLYQSTGIVPQCINGTTSSQQTVITADYYEQVVWMNNAECGAVGTNSARIGVRTYFGVCGMFFVGKRDALKLLDFSNNFASFSSFAQRSVQSDSGMMVQGSMMLLNVNASFDAPQEPSNVPAGTYPDYSSTIVEEDCYSPNNCSFHGKDAFLWITQETNDTCREHYSSFMYANITSGACYDQGGTYTRIYCLGEHSYAQDLMTGNGCERTALSFMYSFACEPLMDSTVHCTAPPLFAPSIPPPPASQSPNTLAIASFTLAIIIPFLAFISI